MDLILIELILDIIELNLEIVGKLERLSKKSLKTIFINIHYFVCLCAYFVNLCGLRYLTTKVNKGFLKEHKGFFG